MRKIDEWKIIGIISIDQLEFLSEMIVEKNMGGKSF